MKIYEALNGQMRLVGGCVRDFLLGAQPQDVDIATPLVPSTVMKCLDKASLKYRVISLRHGVIGVVIGGKTFEITTLRQETYDTGKEVITFITDYEQDAKRRDFTINAMSMDKDTLYDYLEGQADLKSRTIRFIGNPLTRLKEDALRLLRYIRFWSYFGAEKPDESVLSLATELKTDLMNASFNRKKKEFQKIVMSPRALSALTIMEQKDLFHATGYVCNFSKLERILESHPTASLSERLTCFNSYTNRKDIK